MYFSFIAFSTIALVASVAGINIRGESNLDKGMDLLNHEQLEALEVSIEMEELNDKIEMLDNELKTIENIESNLRKDSYEDIMSRRSKNEFTQKNQKILQDLGLYNVDLRVVTNPPFGPFPVSWKQLSRCWNSCEEEYFAYEYSTENAEQRFHVFVNKDLGTDAMPETFNTADGLSIQGSNLHYGFAQNERDVGELFFVVHPNDWGPYQKRFRQLCDESDAEFHNLVTTVSKGASGLATKAAEQAAVWYLGLASAAAISGPATLFVKGSAAAASFLAGRMVERLSGDSLRYIG